MRGRVGASRDGVTQRPHRARAQRVDFCWWCWHTKAAASQNGVCFYRSQTIGGRSFWTKARDAGTSKRQALLLRVGPVRNGVYIIIRWRRRRRFARFRSSSVRWGSSLCGRENRLRFAVSLPVSKGSRKPGNRPSSSALRWGARFAGGKPTASTAVAAAVAAPALTDDGDHPFRQSYRQWRLHYSAMAITRIDGGRL